MRSPIRVQMNRVPLVTARQPLRLRGVLAQRQKSLMGWKKDMSPLLRRQYLKAVVNKEGIKPARNRLIRLATSHYDFQTRMAASKDLKWMRENLKGEA